MKDERLLVNQQFYNPEGHHDLTSAVLFAVAKAKGVDPSAVKSPYLRSVVDAEALEAVFFTESQSSCQQTVRGYVEFEFKQFNIEITSDGWIFVYKCGNI